LDDDKTAMKERKSENERGRQRGRESCKETLSIVLGNGTERAVKDPHPKLQKQL